MINQPSLAFTVIWVIWVIWVILLTMQPWVFPTRDGISIIRLICLLILTLIIFKMWLIV